MDFNAFIGCGRFTSYDLSHVLHTELGGVEMVAGKQIVGAQNIFFAQLADPSHVGLYTHGTRYFADGLQR